MKKRLTKIPIPPSNLAAARRNRGGDLPIIQKKQTNMMYMTRTGLLALGLLSVLDLSGCQSLRPATLKKAPLPANLQSDAPLVQAEMQPVRSEPLEADKVRPPEIYPATGSRLGIDAPAGEPSRHKEGKYTLNFDNADLAEVAKVVLGDTLKVNYVLNPKVTGAVNLQTARPLDDEELISTLEMVLKMNGAVLIREGDHYRIEPEASSSAGAVGARQGIPGRALPNGYQLRAVPLRYVGVAEMQKVVEPILPPKSIIRADELRNVLLLAGTSEELEGVLETIRLFDVDFMRGMSVGLYSLKNVEALTLAEELDKVMGDTSKGPLAGVLRLLPIERLNAILAVSTQPRYLEEVETWVERLDRYSTNRAGGVHVYRVQNVDAMVLAETLSNIFGSGSRQQRGSRGSLAPGAQGVSLGMSGSSGSGFDQDGDSLSQGSSGGGLGSGGLGGSSSGSLSSGGSSLRGGSSSLGGSGSSRPGLGSTGSLGSGGSSASGGGGFGFGSSGATAGTGRSTRSGRGGPAVADLGMAKIVADPANNALIIIAKAQEYKEIETVIRELDVMPLQVLIDATVVEVTLSGNLQYGLEWYFNHGQGVAVLGQKSLGISSGGSSDAAASTTLPDINPESLASLAGSGFGYSFVSAGKDIRLLLNLLASDNKINVISSPSVMVLNNQEAQINVGDTVPLAVGQSNFFGGNLSGSTVTSSFQYVDTGVILRVRPRVNAGGLVTLEIMQEVSTPSEVKVGNTDTFKISKRSIQSAVAVNTGGTLALGGLIRDNRSKGQSGLPFLSKIPYLGNLFGSTRESVDRTELVVLLTPRVVQQKKDISAVTLEFKRKLSGLFEETGKPGEVRIKSE